MPKPLKVLILEDNPADAELVLRELRRAGFAPEWQRVDSEADYLEHLHGGLDLVLSDYEMPQFSGLRAAELLKQSGLAVPFIIISGTIGEETAVEAMRQGATDYLLKDRLVRLGPAVKRALEEARLQRERLLREEDFRLIFAQNPMPMWVYELETLRFLAVNDAAVAHYGHAREEFLALTLREIRPPEEVPRLLESVRNRPPGMTRPGIWRHRKKDGSEILVETTAHRTTFNGKPAELVLANDVTHRLAAEQALRASEGRLRTVTDNARVGLVMVNRERRYTFANATYAEILGLTSAEIVGQRVADVLGPLYDEQIRPRLDRAFAGERVAYELHRPAPDKAHYYAVRYEPTQVDGAVPLVVVVLTDITERKHAEEALQGSEERFRQVVENINEVFWMTDSQKNRMLYISPAYEKIWGRTCESLYESPRNWIEAIYPEDREKVVAAMLAKQIRGDYNETYRIMRPDGSIRWIHDRAYPIQNHLGRVYRVVGTAVDITEHHHLEAQFRQAQKMEAIGTLAGGIAHDFNNILGGIIGYAELTKLKLKDNPAASAYLDSLLQGAHRAASLVRQILAFSRQQEQQRALIQLRHVVAEPLSLLRATIPSTIAIESLLASDLPAVLADATQVHQVVMNLCTNAWHAMKDRPGRLEVRLDRFDVDEHLARANPSLHAGPYVRLTVSDTGCGMDRATLEHIFEPFFTTKPVGEGTGLGLSAVHGIMKSHEGAVTVYSQPGEGTTFHLYFPAQDAEADKVEDPSAEVPRGHGELVLFVDDEKPLALLGRAMLSELDYVVTICNSPAEALDIVRAEPGKFALVITDLTMPVMTGADLAKQLLQISPDLPVILTTGYTASLTPEKIKTLGVRELLLKPHTLRSLGTAVHRVLART